MFWKYSIGTVKERMKTVDIKEDLIGLPRSVNEKRLFFAFLDYKFFDERIHKTRFSCIGFHLFETFGLDFDGDSELKVIKVSVSILRLFKNTLMLLHLQSTKILIQ